jgi:hypothetical protein
MSKPRRAAACLSPDDDLFTGKRRKSVPHEFVLDAIASLGPRTNPMFGCLAVYIEDKIVLILRDKPGDRDNGVWLATTQEHHESLRREFPRLRSIDVLANNKVTGWQVIPADAPDFEETALRVCDLIVARDHRIGKVPKAKRSSQRRPRKPREREVAKKHVQSS